MPAPTITDLPTAPLRSMTSSTFISTAEAWVDALADFVTETNAVADYLDGLTGGGGAITGSAWTMATNRILGRVSASTGAIEELTAAQVKTLLALAIADVSGLQAALDAKAAAAPSIQSVTSSATVTPTFSDDMVKITAQAAGLTLANPTGTAVPGRGMAIRIKDNGTARGISYGTQYRAIGVTLPTTTVVSKTLYLGLIYNSDDTKWDVVAVAQEA